MRGASTWSNTSDNKKVGLSVVGSVHLGVYTQRNTVFVSPLKVLLFCSSTVRAYKIETTFSNRFIGWFLMKTS